MVSWSYYTCVVTIERPRCVFPLDQHALFAHSPSESVATCSAMMDSFGLQKVNIMRVFPQQLSFFLYYQTLWFSSPISFLFQASFFFQISILLHTCQPISKTHLHPVILCLYLFSPLLSYHGSQHEPPSNCLAPGRRLHSPRRGTTSSSSQCSSSHRLPRWLLPPARGILGTTSCPWMVRLCWPSPSILFIIWSNWIYWTSSSGTSSPISPKERRPQGR